jgi:DNA-binding NarL/FixJ family response regulator
MSAPHSIQRLGSLLASIEGTCDQIGIRCKAAVVSESAKRTKRIRILLADDDLEILAATGKFLQAHFDVVDMVSDGLLLVDAAFKLQPDVIVTDISMPKMNGLEAVRKIRSSLPGIKFVFLTMYGAKGYRKEAQNLGAAGYVLKSSAREQLNQAIHTAMEGSG